MDEMIASVMQYLAHFTTAPSEERRADEIIRAVQKVDRKHFVNEPGLAYEDLPMKTVKGQTISQPSTVARMLLLAEIGKGQKVLEVGSGSGWSASLTGFLVHPGKVSSIERLESLTQIAALNHGHQQKAMGRRKLSNVSFETKNFFSMLEGDKTFDRVIITAGMQAGQAEMIVAASAKLLRSKGILVCPQVSGPMIRIRKKGDELILDQTQEEYAFVPLVD